jgi:hypothetical protein
LGEECTRTSSSPFLIVAAGCRLASLGIEGPFLENGDCRATALQPAILSLPASLGERRTRQNRIDGLPARRWAGTPHRRASAVVEVMGFSFGRDRGELRHPRLWRNGAA